MANRRPIITLTTDFGLANGYVASMKAVILSRCPDARLVDVTNALGPGDVLRAALILEATVPYFPRGSVHLAVVDPGVGSGRRALALAADGQYFVGPDNGLFTPFLGSANVVAYTLPVPGPGVSATFHGRDVFAPAAAELASGTDVASLGKPVRDPVLLDWPTAEIRGDEIRGEVIYIDGFGNCVTSIRAEALDPGMAYTVRAGGRDLDTLRKYYAEVPAGEALALINSMGRLEIAVNGGSAADLGFSLGEAVILTAKTSS